LNGLSSPGWNGGAGYQVVGTAANDYITGSKSSNLLDGNGGRDVLTGLGGSDIFRFSTRPSFGSSSAVHITDFSAFEGDSLLISKNAFGIPSTSSTVYASVITVNNASSLTSAFQAGSLFVYDSSSGSLYFDQNGSANGFGAGGVFAVLDNKASISSLNVSLL